MNLSTMLIIAIGLSMDAFTVSVARGMSMKTRKVKGAAVVALFFGSFQALMPILGWWAGLSLRELITGIDHWIAFVLLLGVGVKMIIDGIKAEPAQRHTEVLSVSLLLLLSVATSIDALAVGLSFACFELPVFLPSLFIGVVTFSLSFIGVFLGEKIGNLFAKKVEVVGGLILIGIGTKILLEHLGYLH